MAGGLAIILIAAGVAVTVVGGGGAPERSVYAVPGHPTGIVVGGGQVWVAAPETGALIVLDARTGQRAEAPLRTTGAPARLALGAHGVWVADTAGGAIVPVDRDGWSSFAPIEIGADVADVALSARAVWAISSAEGVVRVIEPGGARAKTLPVGRNPVDVAAGGPWVAIRGRRRRDAHMDRRGGPPGGRPRAHRRRARRGRCGRRRRVGHRRRAEHRHACGPANGRRPGRAIPVGVRPIAVAADRDDEVYVLCAGDGKVWSVEADGDVAWTRTAGTDPSRAGPRRAQRLGRRRRWRRGDPLER